MPILSDAEEDEVKPGDTVSSKMSSQVILIFFGRFFRRKFTFYPVDVPGSNACPGDQFCIGESEIALLMICRNTPLIGPKEVGQIPSDVFAV